MMLIEALQPKKETFFDAESETLDGNEEVTQNEKTNEN